jgi:hypothetical protein
VCRSDPALAVEGSTKEILAEMKAFYPPVILGPSMNSGQPACHDLVGVIPESQLEAKKIKLTKKLTFQKLTNRHFMSIYL